MTNRPVDLIDAWSALEVLSPQTYRREAELASGAASNIVQIGYGLPWDRGPAPSKPGSKVFFHLVLGTLEAGPAYEALVERFKDNRVERPRVDGNIILASILVDKNGVPAGDLPISVSAFGWGFPRALRSSLKELAQWTDAEQPLIEGLRKRLPTDDQGSPAPLTLQSLHEAFEWLVATLGLAREDLKGPSFAVRTFMHFKSQIVPDALLLNSFFLRDLARARDLAKTGKLPHALALYLGERRPLARHDLLHDPAALEAAIAPSMAPLGRWPTAQGHTPSLLQQAAVNLTARMHGQAGMLGINGPPGTGKSTLLRDTVADVVSRRALAMCAFTDPAQAFKVGWTKRARGETQELYALDPSLRGFELIVASSNNKAVENVSAELPASSAMPVDSELRYFAPLASELIEREAWGMAAAVLGNSANRARFRKAFWNESPRSFQRYLDRAAGFAQDGDVSALADACDAPTSQHEAKDRWSAQRQRFKQAWEAAQARLTELERLRQALLDLPRFQSEESAAQAEFAEAHRAAEAASTQESDLARELRDASIVSGDRQAAIKAHDAIKPSFVSRLFRTQEAKRWNEEHDRLGAQLTTAKTAEREASSAHAAAESAVVVAAQRARACDATLERAREHLLRAHQATQTIGIGADARMFDAAFMTLSHDQKQQVLPWLDREVQAQRAAVFESAIHLHKAFIDAAAVPLRRNLQALMYANFTNIPPDRKSLAGDLWASLFLVIPVVSTTFASVERMLGRLPTETFGWLLIDEAGQASPQAAVGAVMRARRTVVVGDPQQIEPVVTLPNVLTSAVMHEFRADPDRFAAPQASVQTLADDASDHCATFQTVSGTRTVGAPLLVHRRCSSPMFEISNKIAYGGQMVQAKTAQPSPILDALGPSRWIDVRGTAREKFSPEEGAQVLDLLHTLRRADAAPDLYIITPFVQVQNGLRELVSGDGVLSGWVADPRSWPRERIGTVHTVQGREADAVILVLGAPLPAQNGARQWAGGAPNLLNVAATRAKEALYVVGNREQWASAGHFGVLARALGA